MSEDLVFSVAEAMEECLFLRSGDRVLILYDRGSIRVASAIAVASDMIGARAETVDIDSYQRPLTTIPRELEQRAREGFDASFYVAGVRPGELPFRSGLVSLLTGSGASHVHMPKATLEILSRVEGCSRTARIIRRLYDAVEGARTITVEAPAGTRVELAVGAYRWVPDDGVIRRGEWGNWPPGEVYTTPSTGRGTLVVDGVLGSYFSTKYGLLGEPVRVEVRDGVVTSVEGGPVARELWNYITSHECGPRLGEIGIGGNPHIEKPIGNMLHDEKMPGAHIAAGDPLGRRTGAPWGCPLHVDMLPLRSTVRAGTTTLVSRGRLLV